MRNEASNQVYAAEHNSVDVSHRQRLCRRRRAVLPGLNAVTLSCRKIFLFYRFWRIIDFKFLSVNLLNMLEFSLQTFWDFLSYMKSLPNILVGSYVSACLKENMRGKGVINLNNWKSVTIEYCFCRHLYWALIYFLSGVLKVLCKTLDV